MKTRTLVQAPLGHFSPEKTWVPSFATGIVLSMTDQNQS